MSLTDKMNGTPPNFLNMQLIPDNISGLNAYTLGMYWTGRFGGLTTDIHCLIYTEPWTCRLLRMYD